MNGKRSRQLRLDLGLTQSELGNKLGVIKQTVSNWENDICDPDVETMVALADLFGISVDDLVGHLNDCTIDTKIYFSTNLSYLRKRSNLTQEEVAEGVGLGRPTISLYEIGAREPTLKTLVKLSQYFSVSIDDLLLKDLRPQGTLLSRNLGYLHSRANCSQEKIAMMLGIRKTDLVEYETGMAEMNNQLLVEISEIFEVTVDDLLKKELSEGGT